MTSNSSSANTASLRERQQRQTRTAIVEAYLTLAHSDGAAAVSIPSVALESGISVRTIYRYFPNKDALQTAAAFHMSEQALHGGSMNDTTALNLTDQLKMLWTGLAQQIPAVIAERTSPAGRQLRITRLVDARKTSAAVLPEGASPESVDLVIAVTSSSMFLELVERMDYAPEVAADMSTRLVNLILNDPEITGEQVPT